MLENDKVARSVLRMSIPSMIKMINGDFFDKSNDEYWKNSDFILANATWYVGDMMKMIYEKLKLCKPGTWFVSVTRMLPEDNDQWIRVKRYTFSFYTLDLNLRCPGIIHQSLSIKRKMIRISIKVSLNIFIRVR